MLLSSGRDTNRSKIPLKWCASFSLQFRFRLVFIRVSCKLQLKLRNPAKVLKEKLFWVCVSTHLEQSKQGKSFLIFVGLNI